MARARSEGWSRHQYGPVASDRARSAPAPSFASISATGAPLRRCFYCQRGGNVSAGIFFPLLGRKEFAHVPCRQERLVQLKAAREAKACGEARLSAAATAAVAANGGDGATKARDDEG